MRVKLTFKCVGHLLLRQIHDSFVKDTSSIISFQQQRL